MKKRQHEEKLVAVDGESQPKRAGETHAEWKWVERAVWTERMLKALVTGVKGGKWYSLMDKVYAKQNLYAAYKKVAKNKGSAGVDGVTIRRFQKNLEGQIDDLHKSLKNGTYQMREIKRVMIPKAGSKEKRPLGIPTVRDRVVQTALRSVLEPIFEMEFAAHSYGFRPGRGAKDALRRVDNMLKKGKRWVIDLDFKSYFDTIPHDQLLNKVGEKVGDGKIMALVEQFLSQRVMDAMKSWTPTGGTPQGGVISPLLSNIYLNELDHLMVEEACEMVRYADDAVMLCDSEEQAMAVMEKLKSWTEQAGLILHPTKTKIVEMTKAGGFDFLGYHFAVSKRYAPRIDRWPRMKSMKALRSKVKTFTKRCNGHSMEAIIRKINPTLKGWFEYFKQSKGNTFKSVDGWVRMRLRSILRKRAGRRGRGRGDDHHRWPNAYFRDLGLYSMEAAHKSARSALVR